MARTTVAETVVATSQRFKPGDLIRTYEGFDSVFVLLLGIHENNKYHINPEWRGIALKLGKSLNVVISSREWEFELVSRAD